MSAGDTADELMALMKRWRSASPVRRGEITQEQYWVLKSLRSSGPMKVKDLARTIGCTAGSASIAVKRLERDGLVHRERMDVDERVVMVSLSKKGEGSLEDWRKEQVASFSSLLGELSSRDRQTLNGLLAKMTRRPNMSSSESGEREGRN